MSASVVLTVAQSNSTEEYSFDSPGHCIVGRADDCDVQLPNDPHFADVSRHHCLFEIEPPRVRVRDLGSLNGTYVNDERVGRRRGGQSPREAAIETYVGRELKDGDEVRVGGTVIQVGIVVYDWQPDSMSSL